MSGIGIGRSEDAQIASQYRFINASSPEEIHQLAQESIVLRATTKVANSSAIDNNISGPENTYRISAPLLTAWA